VLVVEVLVTAVVVVVLEVFVLVHHLASILLQNIQLQLALVAQVLLVLLLLMG
jgi:hypothetical protein